MPPDRLSRRITVLPASPHGGAAVLRLHEAAERDGVGAKVEPLLASRETAAFLGTALGDCPYLLDLACRDAGRLAAILDEAPEARLDRQVAELAAAEWGSRPEAMAGLRRAKQDVALTLGLADLARAVPLDAVTAWLTAFADAAVGAALGYALAEAQRSGKWVGDRDSAGFTILALGKYGAHELNYSSDIDIIALFDPDAPGLADGVEPSSFWVRIVRTLVALLQERTADSYVFRTDLRLRPDPGATPVALSAPAALLYYESMGQNWERAALIKARACAGDVEAGRRFIAEIGPFIWRKYLDFAAIADIHSIKRQVHAHRGHAEVCVLGHDIKRGRGGIREIEFFAQTQQLIAGGRDPTLRGRETRPMLARLAATGWIEEAVRAELDAAYVVLRDVEHRLQMVRDEQTHTMPRSHDELARIGRLMGRDDASRFEAELHAVLDGVARRYSELFEDAPELSARTGSLVFTGADDDPDTLETLQRLGFKDPPHVTSTVRAWHFGRFAAMRSTAARESLTEITPSLLEAFAKAGNPDAALRAFDLMLKAMPAGAQLFALLTNNRELLDLLATILGAAPRLADIFARRPHVVDALIDPASFGDTMARSGFANRLDARIADASSYEDALNRARLFAAEHRFLISVGLLNGRLDPDGAGRGFSDLAEAVVDALFRRTLVEFAGQHGVVAGGKAAILAFGRLGSREMTAGSDLDLIVIYDHAPDAEPSDGARPLSASQYYARLTQRFVAALSAPTAEGIAYPVDLRLRPSGRAGPLATHVAAFERYQMEEAWTWEHMAMSRGRPIAGEPSLLGAISEILDRVVDRPRERAALAADVADMRARIAREKAVAGPFAVKTAPGGLVDCEFAVQFLMLAGLGRRSGETTPESLARAEADGAVGTKEAGTLIEAARLQSALLQLERIASEKPFEPGDAPDALKKLMAAAADAALGGQTKGEPALDFAGLEILLPRVQSRARAAFEAVLGIGIA